MKITNYLLALVAGLSIANATDYVSQTLSNEKSQDTKSAHLVDNYLLRRRQETTGSLSGKLDSIPDIQRFSSIKGGMLMKNQEQTLCEVALVNQRLGFVAASCLEYTDNQFNVDPLIRYVVTMSHNTKDYYVSQIVESVKVNPNYNPITFENNIALLFLETNTVIQFQNTIADWASDWNQLYYVHRSLTDSVLMSWNEPYITVSNRSSEITTNMEACSAASSLYANNQGDFLCSSTTLTYYYARDCNIPYGTVYGVNNDNVAAAAIFSHTAVYGDGGFCGTGKLINYYLILRNYIKWAEQVSGLKINVYHSANAAGYTPSSDPNYSMKLPSGSNDKGVNLYGNFTMESIPANSEQMSMIFAINDIFSDASDSQTDSDKLSNEIQPMQVSETIDNLNIAPNDTFTKYVTDLVTQTTFSTELATATTTSTATETISVSMTTSTTEIFTSTMTITDTTVATSFNDPIAFDTNVMRNTAQQSITVTVSVTDTVTETAINSASEETPAGVELVQPSQVESAMTITVTVDNRNTDNIDTDMDSLNMAVSTVTIVSTILEDLENSTATITEMLTVSASAETITSYVTLTDIKAETVTSILPITVSGYDNTMNFSNNVENESTETSPAESGDDSNLSGGVSVGVIVAIIVLLLLLLTGLLYYLFVYRRKKRNLQQQQCGYGGLYSGVAQNRVQKWFMEKMLRPKSGSSNNPPDYSTIYHST
ncbi:hypothetical protein COEREDRAFT_88772 [Coemansia reversa NRRL 1564]|uniref:Peptidase S1 domain-containing protein n=1 Tax=Coemansia reversa (strain ATCC 12441 / NRRL 1564) TaxID=763665 RepID=A0A2G5B5R3_COERN|nr:hypothetical protein COEREDRAFT_88772 [Coemansia reversa NRRL 1564]|eukprot:PIA14383.1 hypothetical protein COEREDRAFT_88772 [Coemansia reversa NRRL 1564]